MESLLREIQAAAIDDKISISVVLRKCTVLATRLGHKDFAKWVERELNGYESKEDLPSYRVFRCPAKGHFSGSFGRGLRDAPIPPACLPENLRPWAEEAILNGGVSSYEALTKTDSGIFSIPWPADLILIVQGTPIYDGMVLGEAWQEVPAGALVSLLDTVRNKVLDFALKIEAEDPGAGDAPLGKPVLEEETVNQIYQTVIYAERSPVAIGGRDFSQSVQNQVVASDIESLRRYLSQQLGVPDEDLSALEDVLSKEGKPGDSETLGPKVADWIGKMTAKTLSGAWKVSTSVAADLLKKAILVYYGVE